MATKSIITGASGFIGANLCRRLHENGHEVHLLVRPSFDNWRIKDIQSEIRIHVVNFLSRHELTLTLDTVKPDFIFHLAANGAYSFQNDSTEIFETNVLGTKNLVDTAISVGFQAFVNAGSSSEYGFKKSIHKETDMIEPNSAYAVSKAAGTHYCSFMARERKLRIPTLRLYSVYGRYEDPRRLLPTLVLKALEGKYPPLVSPDTARDFVFIEDVIEAFLAAAEKTPAVCSEIYNVSTAKQTSLRELITQVQVQFNIKESPTWGAMPPRSWDSDCWVGSNEKIRLSLGWEPRYPLSEGLQNLAEWFISTPEMKRHYEKTIL